MRKAIIVVLTLLIACWSVYASGPALSQPPLSEMTEAECIEFIQDSGITIPQQFADDPTLGASIKDIIQQVEADPNVVIMYNYSVSHNFFNAVKAAVLEYHGITDTSASARAATAYELQDNVVLGEWSSSYNNYNCYAYALDRTDGKYEPGDFSGRDFVRTDPIATQAGLVCSDLAIEYTCVYKTPIRPTYSSLPSGAKAICIRQADTTLASKYDFHFMKLTSEGWKHKPGYSIPLRYLHVPSNSLIWTQEYVGANGPALGSKQYDSDIYYIIYSNSHQMNSSILTGNNYHSGVFHYYEYGDVCSGCGYTANTYWTSVTCDGPPCAILNSLDTDIQYIY